MSPLKYRAYWHRQGTYVPVRTILCNPSGSPIAITTGGLDAKRIPISEVTLERWTGRYDRNGVDIFEGDLLQRYINPAGEYYYAANITVVEWRETLTYSGFGITERTQHRVEVVGNRHQHGALLEAGVAV